MKATQLDDYLTAATRAKDFAKDRGLNQTELDLLLFMLAENMGPLGESSPEFSREEEYSRRNIRDIQLALRLPPSKSTHAFKRMFSERGYVQKVINPYDEQRRALGLTASGMQVAREAADYIFRNAVSKEQTTASQ